MELILTGDLINAEEAKSIGLVNHVVKTQEELLSLSKTILQKIISKGSIAVAGAIKSINAGYSFEKSGYLAEAENFAACVTTEDFKEGTTAFIEKRKPVFKGK
jgi:enoyl-CoA hydratase